MPILSAGEIIGSKYRIERLIGEGGFGEVFEATTLLTDRRVAIKVLKSSPDDVNANDIARFKREQRAIAKLQSPHTLTLLDYGQTEDGAEYSVTEYIDGEDLSSLLARRGTLSEYEVAHLLAQLLHSLQEAHSVGILHRDIKPANVRIFAYEGDPLRAKLLDFGIAYFMDADEARLTRTGRSIGTPRYMSPEQLHGDELTPGTDIYSLGLVAYDALVGERRAFSGVAGVRLPDHLVVSSELRAIVDGMLALLPEDRLGAAEASHALRALASLQGSTTRTSSALPDTVPTLDEEPPTNRLLRAPRDPPGVDARKTELTKLTAVALLLVVLVVAAIALLIDVRTDDAGPAPTRAVAIAQGQKLPTYTPPARPETVSIDAGVATDLSGLPEGCQRPDPGRGMVRLLDGRQGVLAYIPPTYHPRRPSPVLYVFQDQVQSAEMVLKHPRFVDLADSMGLVLVVLRAMTFDLVERAPEFHNIVRQLEWVQSELCIDQGRRHVLGLGEGGAFASKLACRGEVASVVLSGHRALPGSTLCEGDRPPMLFIAPTEDPSTPVKGGRGCLRLVPVMPLAGHLEMLEKDYGCRGASPTPDEHGCRTLACDHDLTICEVGGGRFWPGMSAPIADLCRTPTPTTFDYFGQLRSFLEKYDPALSAGP